MQLTHFIKLSTTAYLLIFRILFGIFSLSFFRITKKMLRDLSKIFDHLTPMWIIGTYVIKTTHYTILRPFDSSLEIYEDTTYPPRSRRLRFCHWLRRLPYDLAFLFGVIKSRRVPKILSATRQRRTRLKIRDIPSRLAAGTKIRPPLRGRDNLDVRSLDSLKSSSFRVDQRSVPKFVPVTSGDWCVTSYTTTMIQNIFHVILTRLC